MPLLDRRLIVKFDFVFMFLITLYTTIGILSIYSATYLQETNYHLKQFVWMLLGTGLVVLIASVDYHTILRYSWLYYLFVNACLLYLLFTAPVQGVQRYLKLGPLPKFIPAEFLKLSLIMLLAQYFSVRTLDKLRFRDIIFPGILVGIPLALILKQPDLGTAMILIPIFLVMSYVAGFRAYKIFLLCALGLISAFFAAKYVLKPYQIGRLEAFLYPDQDLSGAGYQLYQSKIAIGSAGMFGNGFLRSHQAQLAFLPEQHTDFIFSVFAEQWGFIGCILFMILFLIISWRAIKITRLALDNLGLMLGTGILALLTFQSLINCAMVVGLLPITGIPLPFMSFGGSALLTYYCAVGLLVNVGMRRMTRY